MGGIILNMLFYLFILEIIRKYSAKASLTLKLIYYYFFETFAIKQDYL
jgi:hypothetical protein